MGPATPSPPKLLSLSYKKYRAFLWLGLTLIVMGLSGIVINICADPYNTLVISQYRPGYWCGSVYLLTGMFSVLTCRQPRQALLKLTMAFSILCVIVGIGMIAIAASGVSETHTVYRDCYYMWYAEICSRNLAICALLITCASIGLIIAVSLICLGLGLTYGSVETTLETQGELTITRTPSSTPGVACPVEYPGGQQMVYLNAGQAQRMLAGGVQPVMVIGHIQALPVSPGQTTANQQHSQVPVMLTLSPQQGMASVVPPPYGSPSSAPHQQSTGTEDAPPAYDDIAI